MARFQYKQKSHSGIKTILAICIFVAIIVIFFCGINALGNSTDTREKDSLEKALNKTITFCYATEGSYPESLNYIKENYGLVYDESKYYIDYRAMGSNIKPDVTVVELNGNSKGVVNP